MERVLPVTIRKIHFVGIGGIGMSGLAGLLLEKGYSISGSDLRSSPIIGRLKRHGAAITIGHSASLVKGKDLVCFSSAVRSDNPELVAARRLKIPLIKRGVLLGRILKGKEVLGVAGSHGKTTTTSFASFILRSCGNDVATLVGGIPHYFKAPSWWGKDLFVVETDESDGSFLKVKPAYSLITNIDREHLQFYRSFGALKESFLKFAKNTQKLVIGCADEPQVRRVLKNCKKEFISVGASSKSMLRATEIEFHPLHTRFKVAYKNKSLGRIESSLLGRHNVLNALLVLAFCLYKGYDLERVKEAFRDFPGTRRRLDFRAEAKGVVFVDDYAHHPKEIAATLSALRPLKKKRQVALFQPHRFSRVKSLLSEFATCFKDLDLLIITDIYSASERSIPGVDSHLLIKNVRKDFKKPIIYIPKERLAQTIPLMLKRGDCLAALGAGDSNKILEEVIERWKMQRV